MQINFTVYARPEPQGSSRGFLLKGTFGQKDRIIVTSANKKLKPYRQELTNTAKAELENHGTALPMAGKHVPVSLSIDFYLARPASIPKKRTEMVVKPDLDKLIRATKDALKGIIYLDDGQVVEVSARKHYGVPERAEIAAVSYTQEGVFEGKESDGKNQYHTERLF